MTLVLACGWLSIKGHTLPIKSMKSSKLVRGHVGRATFGYRLLWFHLHNFLLVIMKREGTGRLVKIDQKCLGWNRGSRDRNERSHPSRSLLLRRMGQHLSKTTNQCFSCAMCSGGGCGILACNFCVCCSCFCSNCCVCCWCFCSTCCVLGWSAFCWARRWWSCSCFCWSF